ncbi:E3 ubiquitin-protein ligase TRIM71-like [Saccostrea echinata]|uniref:E3 ubiquitin-protein ligase TRIM71-like n=1 Tax=Saccostrea echinata TaxID=191078 RepID=UPI002A7F1E00|nr:E3 ubiquitin-protein ligase TRIM71-like [Saccostrea echinata]
MACQNIETDISFAQDLITCSLCQNEVDFSCNSCRVRLCCACVGKHMISTSSENHELVRYSLKYETLQSPLCPTHIHQKCGIYCKQCEIPACDKCVVSTCHKNHDFVEIKDVYQAKKTIIKQDTTILKEQIAPEYEKIVEQLEEWINTLPKNNVALKSQVHLRGKVLHEFVDKVVNERISDIDNMEQQNAESLKKHLKAFKGKVGAVRQTIRENVALLQSWDSKLLHFCSNVDQYRNVSSFPDDIYNIEFVPDAYSTKDLSEILGDLSFSKVKPFQENITRTEIERSLRNISSKIVMDDPEIIANISTEYESLYDIACLENDQAWVNGGGIMTRLDIKGKVFEKINTANNSPANGLAVNNDGELLYSDYNEEKIYLVKHGKPRTLIKTQWGPGGICLSASGKILAVTCERRRGLYQVEVFDLKSGSYIKRFELFQLKGGRYLTFYLSENINGDICIADLNAKIVLVFNREGNLRFHYGGKSLHHSFHPYYIATDSQGHILVSDNGNNCVHILSIDGELISVIDKLRLEDPHGISIDKEDKLWLVEKSGKINVIQYLK